MENKLNSIGSLVWLIAYIVLKDQTGWAWYWVALFIFGFVLIDTIVSGIAAGFTGRSKYSRR